MNIIHSTSNAVIAIYNGDFNDIDYLHIRKFELTEAAVTKGDNKVIAHNGKHYQRTRQGLSVDTQYQNELVAALSDIEDADDGEINVAKNKKGETLRVSASHFNDVDYINIRWYFKARGKGDLQPSTNGITIPAAVVETLIAKPKASKKPTATAKPKKTTKPKKTAKPVVETPVAAQPDLEEIPATMKRRRLPFGKKVTRKAAEVATTTGFAGLAYIATNVANTAV